jgi:hypothetical protein
MASCWLSAARPTYRVSAVSHHLAVVGPLAPGRPVGGQQRGNLRAGLIGGFLAADHATSHNEKRQPPEPTARAVRYALAEVIEGVFGPKHVLGGQCRLGVGRRRVEGNPALEPNLTGQPTTALLLVRGHVAGTGFEPVKAMPAILQVAMQAPRGSPRIPPGPNYCR